MSHVFVCIHTCTSPVRGYFGDPFKDQHDMTQGNPLYPTKFNVVEYEVLYH